MFWPAPLALGKSHKHVVAFQFQGLATVCLTPGRKNRKQYFTQDNKIFISKGLNLPAARFEARILGDQVQGDSPSRQHNCWFTYLHIKEAIKYLFLNTWVILCEETSAHLDGAVFVNFVC